MKQGNLKYIFICRINARKRQSHVFSEVIFDFSYFNNSDDIEQKLENNSVSKIPRAKKHFNILG